MTIKRNKNLIILIISCSFLLLSLIASTYAWLIYEKRTSSIDASSTGLLYVYEINDNNTTQTTSSTFTISNLSFFDIDNSSETEYFLDMACMVTLEIRNTGDLDMDYTVSQTAGIYTTTPTAAPGVLCLFATEELDSTDITTSTIADLLTDTTDNIETSITSSLDKYDGTTSNNDIATIYMYIIGVQPTDAATNDFLDDTYSFTISINATSK